MPTYKVTTMKRINYIKSYTVLRLVDQKTNAVSRLMQKIVDRYIIKSGSKE